VKDVSKIAHLVRQPNLCRSNQHLAAFKIRLINDLGDPALWIYRQQPADFRTISMKTVGFDCLQRYNFREADKPTGTQSAVEMCFLEPDTLDSKFSPKQEVMKCEI
jgi:hypothetical protein